MSRTLLPCESRNFQFVQVVARLKAGGSPRQEGTGTLLVSEDDGAKGAVDNGVCLAIPGITEAAS